MDIRILRCKDCFGQGKVMGGGMISEIKCVTCDGKGTLGQPEDELAYLDSEMEEFKKRHPELKADEAEKILKDAFMGNKTNQVKRKAGRPKRV